MDKLYTVNKTTKTRPGADYGSDHEFLITKFRLKLKKAGKTARPFRYDQPRQHVKKQRHHLLTKVHIVKAMDFPVVMYGCEKWTIKKAECQRVDAFELWCWRRFLRVPWSARRSNQSILKEISPEIFTGRTEAEAGAPVLWPPDLKSRLIRKDPDDGKE